MIMNSKIAGNVGKLVLGLGVAVAGIMLISKKAQKADEEERELEMKEIAPEVVAVAAGIVVGAVGKNRVAKAYDVTVEEVNPIIVGVDVIEYYGRKIGLKKIGIGLGLLGAAGIVYGIHGTVENVNHIKALIIEERKNKSEIDRLRRENDILEKELKEMNHETID